MNWLSHVLLSENHIEFQLGNLLTDPLKAKVWEGASVKIEQGVKMHLLIDGFTDSHKIVSSSKALITKRGHLKGVVLDILYDHFLSLHWDRFCYIQREVFLENFRQNALKDVDNYPQIAQDIIRRVVINRQLSSYEHMDGVVAAFRRIDARLSVRARGKDNMQRYIPLIAQVRDQLEEEFLNFFPQLMNEVISSCENLEKMEHLRIVK